MASPNSPSTDDAALNRLRRSNMSSRPPRRHDFDALWQNRHSEEHHCEVLAASLNHHTEVREGALRMLELHQAKERIEAQRRQNEEAQERLRVAEAEAAQALKARELENKQRSIPRPPPRLPTPPPAPTPQAIPPAAASQQYSRSTQTASKAVSPTSVVSPKSIPQQSPIPPQPQPTSPAVQSPAATAPQSRQPSKLQQGSSISQSPAFQPSPNGDPRVLDAKPAATVPSISSPSGTHPYAERYLEIHSNLKRLRKLIRDGGAHNPDFKQRTGKMRRAIKMTLGQLTGEPGSNTEQMKKVRLVLEESLGSIPSPPVDPKLFLVNQNRPPDQNAVHNGPEMPMLFIFLLNIFAKAVIAQLIDESGVRPETADPIGLLAISTFSRNEFRWRGISFIDILMAKFRVVCPVLFGFRGSEKTEEGRKRLGWWKFEGTWVQEQVHNTRMTGLGAGWSSICLRDFSKVTDRRHPWPPTHYWESMAWILRTPRDELSETQYIVLKAMIEGFELKFMTMYGSAALAALQVAFVHFPARAPVQSAATRSLAVLADKLLKTTGWDLKNMSNNTPASGMPRWGSSH